MTKKMTHWVQGGPGGLWKYPHHAPLSVMWVFWVYTWVYTWFSIDAPPWEATPPPWGNSTQSTSRLPRCPSWATVVLCNGSLQVHHPDAAPMHLGHPPDQLQPGQQHPDRRVRRRLHLALGPPALSPALPPAPPPLVTAAPFPRRVPARGEGGRFPPVGQKNWVWKSLLSVFRKCFAQQTETRTLAEWVLGEEGLWNMAWHVVKHGSPVVRRLTHSVQVNLFHSVHLG